LKNTKQCGNRRRCAKFFIFLQNEEIYTF